MVLVCEKKISLDKLEKLKVARNIQSNLIGKNDFCLEMDRLFFCVKDGLEVVSILQDIGLNCPSTIVKSNSQGTLSKIFFFQNIYLAIVWPGDNSSQVLEQLQTGIDFSARANWQQTNASPFGIGLSRRQSNNSNLNINRDLIQDLVIDNNIYYSEQNQKNILEPFVFLLPDHLSFRNISTLDFKQIKKFINHPLGIQKVTNVKVAVQKGKRRDSDIINTLKRYNVLTVDRDTEPLLELTFDRGIKEKVIDIRPLLPIIIKY